MISTLYCISMIEMFTKLILMLTWTLSIKRSPIQNNQRIQNLNRRSGKEKGSPQPSLGKTQERFKFNSKKI
jgi:hypothetical protein